MIPGNRRKWVKIGAGVLGIVAVVLAAIFVLATQPFRDDPRLELPPRQTYTRGQYYSYVAPWGGETSILTRKWSAHADKMWIDLHSYPNNTRIDWRWPPFSPRNGVGAVSYTHLTLPTKRIV